MASRSSKLPWLALLSACGSTPRDAPPTPHDIAPPAYDITHDISPSPRDAAPSAHETDPSAHSTRVDFPRGFFSAAAEVVRFRDKHGGLVSGVVFANGSDWGPQPLTMYAVGASGGGSLSQPWWVSEEAGYFTGLCVGELDGNPGEDIAVTLQKDVYGDFSRGAVNAYYGVGKLERKHEAFRREPIDIGAGFPASGCAIADLDGDGVAEVLTGSTGSRGVGRLFQRTARQPGASTSYDEVLTFGGKDAPACAGDPPGALAPSAVTIADVNGDQIPDLVLAGRRLAIFYGAASGPLRERYAAHADWCSEEAIGFSPSVDVERLAGSERSLVVVSQTCYQQLDCPAKTSWLVYEPTKSRKPILSRTPSGAAIAGPAKLLSRARAGGGRALDLIATVLFDRSHPETFGAALSIFESLDGAGKQGGAARPWHPDYRPVVSMLKLVNLQGRDCQDLLVVSAHPAVPSALFEDVGNCPEP